MSHDTAVDILSALMVIVFMCSVLGFVLACVANVRLDRIEKLLKSESHREASPNDRD